MSNLNLRLEKREIGLFCSDPEIISYISKEQFSTSEMFFFSLSRSFKCEPEFVENWLYVISGSKEKQCEQTNNGTSHMDDSQIDMPGIEHLNKS